MKISHVENKTVKIYCLSDKDIRQLYEAGSNNINSNGTKKIFDNFLNDYIAKKKFNLSQHLSYFRKSCTMFLELIRDINCYTISWGKYCEIMQQINDLKNKNSRVAPFLRDLLCQFFKLYIKNVPKGEYGNIDELSRYSDFLISEEKNLGRTNVKSGKIILKRKVNTNFSINSKPNQIYYHEILSKGAKIKIITLINLNTNDGYLKETLISFIQTFNPLYLTYSHVRTFFYYFSNSLMGIQNNINGIRDFNYTTFKIQYRFYFKLTRFFGFGKKVELESLLIKFYVYLLNYIKENEIEHQIFKGTLIDEHYLTSVYFYNYYERGFVRVNHTHFEDVPKEDRWVVHVNDNNASTRSENLKTLDFTEIKDKEFRSHLKEYFWNQDSASFKSATAYSFILIEFLNNKYKFDNNRKNVYSNCGKTKYDFSNEFLYYQISWIKRKYPEQETKRKILGCLKNFLIYYRNLGIYQVNELLLNELSIKAKKDYSGNPIDTEDLKLIINAFRCEKENSISNELFYIIAILAVSTKLRAGEIINLQRTCIRSRDDNGGKVQYYSKQSGNQNVNIFLSLDKIRLIDRAIEITEDFSKKANSYISKYIFLLQDFRHKDRISRIGAQFSIKFSEIVKSLNGQLKRKYSANNLRHTFIDTIYAEGIREKINPLIMAEMVGNSQAIALKHYRKKTNVVRYAEMFSGVVISNVDITGEILAEKDIQKYNPVLLNEKQQGLGACVQHNCTVNKIEDEYKCLICPFFATTVQRLSIFRVKINQLKSKKKTINHNEELKLIETELKLYSTYYAKLLELRKK